MSAGPRGTGGWRRLVVAGGLGCVAVVLAGCVSAGSGLNMDTIRTRVKSQVQSEALIGGGLVTDVSCPDQRPLKRGDRFTCTATVAGIPVPPSRSVLTAVPGTSAAPTIVTYTVRVTQLDGIGTVRIETQARAG
jgi:hypothetical protein